jgi:hypothetical protein
MDAQIQLLSDFSGHLKASVPGPRLGRPAGDADVAARVLAALRGLQARTRPSDAALDVYRDAMCTLFRQYRSYCLQHGAELVDLITQLGTFSISHFDTVALEYIFTVVPDRSAIRRWVTELHLSDKHEMALNETAFHANF